MEFGVWTLIREFTDYFSNLNVQLLKVEFNINPEDMKCEDCMDRALVTVNATLEASSSTEIDSGLGAVCGLTERYVCSLRI